jgi:exodeoxyribonuclease V alpha subunit
MLEQYYRNKPYLARSKFRSSFILDEKDISYINKVGLDKIKEHAFEFISKRLAPAKPFKDGKQTPYSGHPVFKAQHALAFCCRNCLMKWWKLEKGRELSEEEIEGILKIIIEWIKNKKLWPWY